MVCRASMACYTAKPADSKRLRVRHGHDVDPACPATTELTLRVCDVSTSLSSLARLRFTVAVPKEKILAQSI